MWLKSLSFMFETFCEGLRVRYVLREDKSGTPRGAGGLMSWAASKAVGLVVRRRALPP
jgi:hypothetical protein